MHAIPVVSFGPVHASGHSNARIISAKLALSIMCQPFHAPPRPTQAVAMPFQGRANKSSNRWLIFNQQDRYRSGLRHRPTCLALALALILPLGASIAAGIRIENVLPMPSALFEH